MSRGDPITRFVVVGAMVVDATAALVVVVAIVVEAGLPLSVVDGATDCVVSTAGCIVVETTSPVVEIASSAVSAVVGAADCATTDVDPFGAVSLDDVVPQAPSSTIATGTTRSNARLTTGLGRADARLVP